MSKNSVYFQVDGMADKHKQKEIKSAIADARGVISVTVSSDKRTLAVDYDSTGTDPEAIRNKLDKMCYPIASQKIDEHVM